MGKESSVAPRERVNIVYKPATGNMQEQMELPHKVLVLGDFTGREDDSRIEERQIINIDKDNFNDVLREQNIGVEVSVPNKLSDDPEAEMNLDLKFKNIKDFEPEAVASNIPEINKILKLRNALMSLKGPLSNVPAFRKEIEELIKDSEQKDKLFKELGIDQ